MQALLALNSMTPWTSALPPDNTRIRIEGKWKNEKQKCSRKKGKRKTGKLGYRICPWIILSSGFVLCASIFIHCTCTRAEHAMPKSAAGSQSSPFPCISLLWRTSIVAASAASSASIYNVVQTGIRMSKKGFKSAVPRLAVLLVSAFNR